MNVQHGFEPGKEPIQPFAYAGEMRRLGQFSIPRDMIDAHPEAVRACLAGMIVVKAEFAFHSDCIAYMGISEKFQPVQIGRIAPFYEPLFFRNDDGSIEFKGFR